MRTKKNYSKKEDPKSDFKEHIIITPRGMSSEKFRNKEFEELTPKKVTPEYVKKLEEFRKKWHPSSNPITPTYQQLYNILLEAYGYMVSYKEKELQDIVDQVSLVTDIDQLGVELHNRVDPDKAINAILAEGNITLEEFNQFYNHWRTHSKQAFVLTPSIIRFSLQAILQN